MKKILITLLLLFGMTFPSCNHNSCGDTLPYFIIDGIMLYTGEYWDYIQDDTTAVNWTDLKINCEFKMQYTAMHEVTSGFTLYAEDCPFSGGMGSKIGVDTLYLITKNDYNDEYYQNDTINNIIQIGYYSYRSLSYYIQNNSDGVYDPFFRIKLTEGPSELNQEHQFKLVYILNDGQVFEAETDTVMLQ